MTAEVKEIETKVEVETLDTTCDFCIEGIVSKKITYKDSQMILCKNCFEVLKKFFKGLK